MDRIILHVTYCGENAKVFIEEMQSSGFQAEIQNQAGCIQYDYYTPMDGSGNMFLVEGWKDAESLKAHGESDVMKKVQDLKTKLGVTTTVEKFE